MITLVTGATGFLGRALAEHLLAQGHEVRCLVRRPAQLPAGALAVAGNLDPDFAALPDLRGVELVFHCGAATRKAGAQHDELFRVNQGGTALLAKACAAAGARVVLASSLAAVGPPPPGQSLREDSPCKPLSTYGASKLASEEALRASGASFTLVRLPGLYGPGDVQLLPLFRAVQRHLRPTSAREVPFLHVRDAVTAMACAAAAREPILNAAGAPLTLTECGRAVAAALGVHAFPFPLIGPLLWLADRERAREMAGSWRVDSSRLRALGWAQSMSFAEGAIELAQWYRAQGLLSR